MCRAGKAPRVGKSFEESFKNCLTALTVFSGGSRTEILDKISLHPHNFRVSTCVVHLVSVGLDCVCMCHMYV